MGAAGRHRVARRRWSFLVWLQLLICGPDRQLPHVLPHALVAIRVAVMRLGRVLVLAGALVGLCVAPSLARAAASDYRAAVLADHPISYWPLTDAAGSSVAQDLESVNPGN
jgi:hypothetical protein